MTLKMQPDDPRYWRWRIAKTENKPVKHDGRLWNVTAWEGTPGETVTVTLEPLN